MPKKHPDERLLYLAFRNDFHASNAPLKVKTIRERVLKHHAKSEVKALIQEHNIDNVVQATKSLIEQGVFQSSLRAKIKFPELFEVSPSQSAEREASEAEAAKHEADILDDIMKGKTIDEGKQVKALSDEPPVESRHAHMRKPMLEKSRSLSLYPAYVPFPSQYKLLRRVQRVLEQACFTFAERNIPHVLEMKGWHCCELGELNIWCAVLKQHKDQFTLAGLESIGRPLAALLDSIANLRYTAVHRLHSAVGRLEQFMADAELLCKLLEDDESLKTVVQLSRQTSLAIDDLRRSKDLLESRIASTKREFAKQRAELDASEKQAMAQLLQEDRHYQDVAGEALEKALNPNDCRSGKDTSELDEEILSDLPAGAEKHMPESYSEGD